MNLYKNKNYSKPKRVKIDGGVKKQSEENITESIRNPFKLKKWSSLRGSFLNDNKKKIILNQ